jgi:hypothetical protein
MFEADRVFRIEDYKRDCLDFESRGCKNFGKILMVMWNNEDSS